MSLALVPVCYGCKKSAALSVSCTDCLRIYCANCFGLQSKNAESVESFGALVSLLSVRVCSKCTKPEEPREEEECTVRDVKPCPSQLIPPIVTKVKEEPCWSHGKPMNLFCLTCDVIICGDCFLNGAEHMRHQIDFLETVFREKRLETQHKLNRLEETVGILQREAVHCETNLALIQSAEKAALAEIDAICEEAKLSVSRLTINRKRKLESRAGFPAKKKKLTAALQAMIDQMSPGEFFQQRSTVYKQCDELLTDCSPKGFHVLKFEDVGCELVPPYEMQKFTLPNFDGTFGGWPQHLNTSCDTMWNVFLRKNESLFVKVTPDEPEASKYPYKLLVQVPHPMDIRKSIMKTFTIHGAAKEDEIVSVEQLKADDFIRHNNELVVKIGLRPLNAITENRFLKSRYKALTTTIAELERQTTVSGKDINCKYCIMYFNICLMKVPKKISEPSHSAELVDQMERQWCLRVYPFALTLQETNLKVFVVLRKGTRTKCRYFIELLHDDPAKNFMQCTESNFDTVDAGYGWHSFMERKRLLADPGFYPNSVLRFRFGVQPIDP
ncbi:AAEL014180-PA [Aedes aegypti]|uniref:AAEL014180-PA n=2 Tax=Aedes aegypti TaxID=7159 RepID=A0A1S4G112_AEDAE|nr:E3 ubiquitin-protein ligase TRIM37 [Aedes aegypti]EAT33540.1 AAEL014180-PA [Aedes aegypti]